jgi:hypothetical protein
VNQYGTRAWSRIAEELGTDRPAAAVLRQWVREFQSAPAGVATAPTATPAGAPEAAAAVTATGPATEEKPKPPRMTLRLDKPLERRLVRLVEEQYGTQWEVVGEMMGMEPELAQQHYEALQKRRKLQEGSWAPAEDVCLLQVRDLFTEIDLSRSFSCSIQHVRISRWHGVTRAIQLP